jgi:hypothetical protein
MSSLNLDQHEPVPAKKKNNRNLKIFLGIGALIAVPAIGTTLAASITVNTVAGVQFGQGISQTVSCQSGTLTATPNSSFVNASGAGQFNLGSITLSGISSTCDSKTFTVTVYGDTGTALTIAAPSPTPSGASATAVSVVFKVAGSGMTVVGNTNATVTNQSTTGFTINFATALSAASVYKLTVETS